MYGWDSSFIVCTSVMTISIIFLSYEESGFFITLIAKYEVLYESIASLTLELAPLPKVLTNVYFPNLDGISDFI